MTDRVLLVTGANGGLGIAIAQYFLEHSPQDFVFLGVRQNRDHADALAQRFAGRAEVVSLDVTLPTDWSSTVAHILAGRGRLDVLINNAGCHEDALLLQMRPESWDRVLSSNLDSVFHGCQAVLNAMISQRHGRIINIASLSALYSPAGQANYAAAKAGVAGMTRALARELASRNITVNCVAPGFIETDMTATLSAEQQKGLLANVPAGRLGQPSEIAHAVAYLASPQAAYVTGQELHVNGGMYM